LITSTDVWGKLSDADKAAFKEAAKIALAANRKKVNEDEANGIATIKAGGTEVTLNVDKSMFQKSVVSAYSAYNKEFGEANIKKIMDVK
jgi:TRAP-type C4-dicarboxylate transport system substrate-binding protein